MKKLIAILIFVLFISPNVWGNENKNINIGSNQILAFYQKNSMSLGLNITPIKSIWSSCEQNLLQQNNLNAISNNTHDIFCKTQYIENNQDLFIGIRLSKKMKKIVLLFHFRVVSILESEMNTEMMEHRKFVFMQI